MMEGTENVLDLHDKMRARGVNKVARGQQAPRPALETGAVSDAPLLSPELTGIWKGCRVENGTTG